MNPAKSWAAVSEPVNSMKNLLAPCGIDCSQCDAYKATQTGDADLKQKLAADYLKNFGKEIAPTDLDCDGCPSQGRHIGFCSVCEIRSCAFSRDFSTCAECTDFPCSKGSFIWKEGSKSLETLQKLLSQSVGS
jgi:hypothetical protein